MSAYIVDPRTIDYLVQWAKRHRSGLSAIECKRDQLPERMQDAHDGLRLRIGGVFNDELGQLLLTENVRSVRYRYPNDDADSLPGPIDQVRIWRYRFQPIAQDLNPAWVVKAAKCLSYQSCEHPEWEASPAKAILEAIAEDALYALIDDAPWGIDDEVLAGAR
jgi:hypothetical protein